MAIPGVHAIRTGGVMVKVPLITREGGPITSKLRILTSKSFTPELPVLCWLIEHEEGDVLIDAGMGEAASRPGYLDTLGSFDAWLSRRVSTFAIAPGEGLGPQLCKVRPRGAEGLRIILTHLHIDHIGGLADLPGADILVNDEEWRHPYSAPKRLTKPLRPQLFTWQADPKLPFGMRFPLTRAGDLFAVPTPGHTPHHCSVVLRRGGVTCFFAGDVVYNQDQLRNKTLAGVHARASAATASMQKIETFARNEPCVFLPAHDPQSEQRLERNEFFYDDRAAASDFRR